MVNIRLTHTNKSAAVLLVIIASGVIGQDAPATLDAGSDPVEQANAARIRLAASGHPGGSSVWVVSNDQADEALGGISGFWFFSLLGGAG